MKVQRTSNSDVTTVATVRDLVEQRHLAPSQDALVETALGDFFLAVRYAEEARRFAAAADEPGIAREFGLLEREFQRADREI